MAFNKAKALQEAEKYVTQGKISQAIKQYQQIIEKDPADLTLLNTVGDLCVRDKNVSEALKYFTKLAESYSQEGFTLKAIAIYKKISKLDANAVDVLVKTGELYSLQGLAREAREQFAVAVEAYRKKNQTDKALEAFRKIVALDPENSGYRAKLADFCAQAGRKSDAAKAYAEAAEIAFRHGDEATAESALKKAVGLDDKNPQVQLLRARVAVGKGHPDEAEKIILSVPELKSLPAGQQILLDSYLAARKLGEAEKLVVTVFRANPANFAPVASFAEQCLAKGDCDAALAPLAELADTLLEMKKAGPLMDALRQIWQKNSRHLPSLELIYKVADKSADEATIPEVLEALGDAYLHAGNLEKAEWAYQALLSREPQNANYKGLLKKVLQKQGKDVAHAPSDFAEVALSPEGEDAVSQAAPVTAPSEEEAALVKEALDNSDLFSRYGLAEKAVAELEKVLAIYPDQVDIHLRILEVCQKGLPERAAQAAEALSRIHAARGETSLAEKYHLTATAGAPPPVVESAQPGYSSPAPAAPPAEEVVAEFDISSGFSGMTEEAPPAEALPERPPVAEAEVAPPAAQEFDLSAGFESVTAPPKPEPAPTVVSTPGFDLEESRVEIDFYLSQGFVEEAQKAVEVLKEKFPENPQVEELRLMVEEKAGRMPVPGESVPEAVPEEPQAAEEMELPAEFAQPEISEPPPASGPAAPLGPPVPANVMPEPMTVEPVPVAEPVPAAADPLGSLVGDLAASLEGLEDQAPPSHPGARASAPAESSVASPLSGLLDDLGEEPTRATTDDPQTHYDLGVAFREMSLLDEAIGEFQKVVKGAQKGKVPPNFLQACTLLATCFMDKQMPAIAAKWYSRALETPNLDEEAIMAIEYDMGVAYELAGDKKTALEKFSEVYSQNIDYRDVAEKIRQLQQKN